MHAIERTTYSSQPPRRMRTLGDAVASITHAYLQVPRRLHNKQSINDEYSARTVAYAVSAVLDCREDWKSIPLSHLFALEARLREYALLEGFKPNEAGYYTREIRKILAHASSHGWSSRQMRLIKSWDTATAAFKKKAGGCIQIIDYLISRNRTPSTTTERDLERWAESAEESLELTSIEQYLNHFRSRIRAATLTGLFPHLDLASKGRTRYGDHITALRPGVQAELKKIAKRKAEVEIPDRSTREIARPVSISKIYSSFKRLHGHRTQIRGQKPVESLVRLVTSDNVLPYIDYLENELGHLREEIKDTFNPIMSVVRHDPLFKSRDYEWIPDRIQKVPKERHYKMLLRKEEKAQAYELLGEIPKALRRESTAPGLDAKEVAWFRHDEVLISVLHELAFRQRNVRECQTFDGIDPDLKWEPLTNKDLLDLYIPECVLQAYNDNTSREFLMICFDEKKTKSHRAERVVLPLALASLIEDFDQHHRTLLFEDFIERSRLTVTNKTKKKKRRFDHGHLLLNRNGGGLSQHSLRWQVRRLTRKYIGHKVSPHIWRDIFAAHTKMLAALGLGGGRQMLQRRLFQVDDATTDGYSQLDYALPGIAALDREYPAA